MMAQFYAQIQGNRGTASRMGTKASGMWAHIRGWDMGVKVFMDHDEETGEDIAEIHMTGGSNNPNTTTFLGRWVLVDGKPETR